MSTCILGDIAGNYLTLQALLKKLPVGNIISVGDIVDRGPRSPQVVDYFRSNPDTTTVLYGNHEDLLVDHVRDHGKEYGYDCWLYNGGDKTLLSYGDEVPADVVSWLSVRPRDISLTVNDKKIYVSHTFKPHWGTSYIGTQPLIWNRRTPEWEDCPYDLQVAGHNSQWGLSWFDKTDEYEVLTDMDGWQEKAFAICLDDSRSKLLTALHLETLTIYQQEYID